MRFQSWYNTILIASSCCAKIVNNIRLERAVMVRYSAGAGLKTDSIGCRFFHASPSPPPIISALLFCLWQDHFWYSPINKTELKFNSSTFKDLCLFSSTFQALNPDVWDSNTLKKRGNPVKNQNGWPKTGWMATAFITDISFHSIRHLGSEKGLGCCLYRQ